MGFLLASRPLGVFPQTQTGKSGGQTQPVQNSLKLCFTILSSSEWKVIIARIPSFSSKSKHFSIASVKAPSSSLTAILIA